MKVDEKALEKTEDQVMQILRNDPDKLTVLGVVLEFKMIPKMMKYKGRNWARNIIEMLGIKPDEESSNTDISQTRYFELWGQLNLMIQAISKEDGSNFIVDGKEFKFYPFDVKTDLDYSFLFEKFAMSFIQDNFGDEEVFVSNVIFEYIDWKTATIPETEAVKNS